MLKKMLHALVCAAFIGSSLAFAPLPEPALAAVHPQEGGENPPPRYPSHYSDALLSYQPMPLPPLVEMTSALSALAEEPPLQAYVHNLTTGATETVTPDPGAAPYGPGSGESEDVQALSFGSLSLVNDTTLWPYRASVKLYFTSGGSGYQCSGTLIDPKHILTAGHCVYYNGNWSENYVIIPGFDSPTRPFGDANGISSAVFNGWHNTYDWDYDIGFIELDRPVGFLTGWHGYGNYNTCADYQSGTWRHSGYPAESPYNGQDMYTRSGAYDSCQEVDGTWYGQQLEYNTYSYGGQSGTGAVRDNMVGAVLSNGNSTLSHDIRIHPEYASAFTALINEVTPSSVDLIPLRVNAPASVSRGQTLSGLSFTVGNYSSANWSGTFNYSIYLSTDNVITSADTLLMSGSAAPDIASRTSAVITPNPQPTVPYATVQAGNYYIGVIIDTADYDTGNNAADGQDADTLSVTTATCYTLTTNVTGSGSINTDPLPNCSGNYYTSGTSVQLTAVPAGGYAFTGWSGALSGSTNPASLLMDGEKSVTAAFGSSYASTEFSYGSGWSDPQTPRVMADVNADGYADIVGFSPAGVRVALGNGATFAASTLWLAEFGSDAAAGGWDGAQTIRTLADVNADGRADIVGFGSYGVLVSLSTGASFSPASYWIYGFGSAPAGGGWNTSDNNRVVADVNGDGRADVVGYGLYGVQVALSTGTSFETASYWTMGYGRDLGGWDGIQNPRMVADVNGDGCGDVVGFANYGVLVSLSNACGSGSTYTFGSPAYWAYGYAYQLGGWDSTHHIRTFGDVNNDGYDDLVGFGDYGVLVSTSNGSSLAAAASYWKYGYGYVNGGWQVAQHPRAAADVNNDGRADVVGFATNGILVSPSTGSAFE